MSIFASTLKLMALSVLIISTLPMLTYFVKNNPEEKKMETINCKQYGIPTVHFL